MNFEADVLTGRAGHAGKELGGLLDSRTRLRLVLLLALFLPAPPSLAQLSQGLEVRFGPEADYGPFVYAEANGQVQGLSIDMLRLVAQRAGLGIVTLPPRPLQELLNGVRRGEVDLLSSLRPTPERAAYLLFSRPYVSVPAVLVLRSADPLRELPRKDLWQALHRKPAAVGSGYAVESFVRGAWPDVGWQGVPDDVQALRGLQQGIYAAAVVDLASLAFIVGRHGLKGLEASHPVGFDYALSFGVRRERADVLDRIEAGLAAIPAAERAAVVARWMAPLEMHDRVRSPWPVRDLVWLLLSLGIAAGAWGWIQFHRRQDRL